MLSIRRIGPVMLGIGLLAVGASLWLPGMVKSVTGNPGSHALGGPIQRAAQPVGYSVHVVGEPDPSRYVGLVEAGGATSLRDDVHWAFVERAQGRFDWSGPDEIVTEAAKHHLHALLIVDTSPLWASGGSPSNPNWYWLPPRNPAAYGAFAGAVAARYGPDGVFWREHPRLPRYLPAGLELWNEENIKFFWGDRTPSPSLYSAMVIAAYSRIKRADPAMTVVLGGLAPEGAYDDVTCSGHKGTGYGNGRWNGLNYLQILYSDGIHGHFDAVGWHPYFYWKGALARWMLEYNVCSAWSQMASTPVSVRSLMIANGDGAKRIWNTEVGVPSCVANATYNCVSPAQQADLADAEVRIWRTQSWAGGFYWYEIRDEGAAYGVEAHFGAVSADNRPKPLYRALQQAWG